MTRLRSLLALFVLSFVLVTSVLAWTYRPVAAAAPLTLSSAVLRMSDDSLTDYLPTSGSLGQDLCLADEHRGVGLNGVPTLPAPHGLMMGANPLESASSCGSSRILNGVDLVTGVFTDTQIYLNLPTLGSPWIIGATTSSASSCSGASEGYQGNNWAAFSAPEVIYEDRGTEGPTAEDFLYIVYGADRYVEFQRDGTTAYFLGVNGAGGVVRHITEDHEYVYYDILGTEARFFDETHTTTEARGQLWKITSGNERVCSVGGDPENRTRANAYGAFDATGGPEIVFDGSGRRFTYTYSSGRLVSVVAAIDPDDNEVWDECGKVEFEYYSANLGIDTQGSTGDLGLVKVTTPVSDGYDLVTVTHYRYYKDADSEGNDHELKMVVQAEGVRRYGIDNPSGYSATLAYYDDVADSALYSYASHRFEYNGSGKIASAWFTGDCGCSGGSEGEYEITYGTQTPASSYDGQWTSRAVVKRPDDTYLTQYFDQVGQPLSTVITSHEPGTTPTWPATMETWATRVERNSSGLVYEVATPANASTYDHTSGAITANSSSGLIRTVTFATSPAELVGLQESSGWKVGTTGGTGKEGPVANWTYSIKSVAIPGSGPNVIRPVMDEYWDYYSPTAYDTTEYEYKWGNGLHVEATRTTYPAVPTSENGSGTALEALAYFDADEQLEYSKSIDGVISQFKYDGWGRIEESIEDVDYSSSTESTEPLSGDGSWDFSEVGAGTPFHYETSYTYDCVGRVLETTLPSSRVTKRYYSMLADGRQVTLTYPKYESGTTTFHGPVDFTVSNHAGKAEESGRIGLSGNTTTLAIANHVDETDSAVMDAFDLITGSELVRRRRSVFNDTGTKRLESHLYFDLSFTGSYGTEGIHFDATYYHHDEMGRQVRVEEPSGTIYRTAYDVLGRAVESTVGTNDYGQDGSDNTGGPANMVLVGSMEYDQGNDGGNSLLTSRVAVENEAKTETRVTEYHYDQRDRLALIESPTTPYTFYGLDYRGRRTATGLYSSITGINLSNTSNDEPGEVTTGRLALSQQAYDKLGRVWKSTRHEIVQTTGAKGESLEAESWYDTAGRLIKHQGGEFYKIKYDRIGRVFNRYELAELDTTEAANHAYADAYEVSGDVVLEESQARYDAEDNVILSATIMRHHNDKGGSETKGALDANSDGGTPDDLKLTIGDLEGRAHINAYWYDTLGRLETSANFGTFDDSTFDLGSEPEPSATISHSATSELVLVTKYSYGTDGAVETVTDENGTPNLARRDAAGRVTEEIRNYLAPGDPDDDDPDVNIRVNYTYENGLRTEYIADREVSADDQVTTYIYGTDKGDESEISTGHLLRRVIYPDGDTTDDNVTYAYNAQGEQIYRKDQAGNVLERAYDDSGRLIELEATAIDVAFDDEVERISRTYDDLGRTLTVKQYHLTGGTALLDEVSFNYDDWGMREDFVQDVNGATAGGVYTLRNEWERATGGRQTLRLKVQAYPSGNFVEPNYLATHNLFDNAVSRVTALGIGKLGDPSGTLQVSYDYLGSSWAVRTEYMGLDIQRSLHDGAGSPSALIYDALDSLWRIKHDRWEKVNGGGNNVMFYDVDLAYQDSENVLNYVVDNVTTGFDVDYGHDAAQRLAKADEGTLDANGDMVTSPSSLRTRYQDWQLDPLGNWENTRLGLDSDLVFTGTGELDEDREHNEVNELTDRGTSIDLVYDAVGNLIDDGEDYKYEYDVFGRQVAVLNQSDVAVANYKYNGLGYLIQEQDDPASGPWYHNVYDGSWRVVAKYLAGEDAEDPDEEYFYHRAGRDGLGGSSYIDLVAIRDRDVTGDDELEERIFYCQDRMADVVAVLASDATVLEWVGYSAYGVPNMSPPGDMNGDGKASNAELAAIQAIYTPTYDPVGYEEKADINLDGVVNSDDYVAIGLAYRGVQYGVGALSSAGNVRGFRGGSLAGRDGASWRARSRVLLSRLGRWDRRDPTGYEDGPSLYLALQDQPLVYADPNGWYAVKPGGGGMVLDRVYTGRTKERSISYSKTVAAFGASCTFSLSCFATDREYYNRLVPDFLGYKGCLERVEKEYRKSLGDCDVNPWEVIGLTAAFVKHTAAVIALAAVPPPINIVLAGKAVFTYGVVVAGAIRVAKKYGEGPSCRAEAAWQRENGIEGCKSKYATGKGGSHWDMGSYRCFKALWCQPCGDEFFPGLYGPGLRIF